MAIYHLTAKTGSRNGGQSAKAKADYIQREGRYSRDRDEVLHTQSGHLPEWAERPADYWDAADLYERANGRLFKEVEFALPVELTLDQQRELVDEFARHLTEGERLPYTLAIHAGKGENSQPPGYLRFHGKPLEHSQEKKHVTRNDDVIAVPFGSVSSTVAHKVKINDAIFFVRIRKTVSMLFHKTPEKAFPGNRETRTSVPA